LQAFAHTVPVIVNPKAGQAALADAVRQALPDARWLEGKDPRELARRALYERPPVVVAAGGDGTVSAVADVVRGSGSALGILPVGTMNHFARDLGIPLDPTEAARAIARRKIAWVDLGEVNGRCFVNNASLGLYPGIVRERERQQRRLRRSKRAAMLWATLAVLNRPPLLDLRLQLSDGARECAAPFVFIGNNDYELEGFNIGRRARLDGGSLSVYTTRRCGAAGLLGLALRALLGRLRQADDFIESPVERLRIVSRKRELLVATDGEVRRMATPLELRVLPRALQVVVP
jgi:diacylglycerol kinase family enzyme